MVNSRTIYLCMYIRKGKVCCIEDGNSLIKVQLPQPQPRLYYNHCHSHRRLGYSEGTGFTSALLTISAVYCLAT